MSSFLTQRSDLHIRAFAAQGNPRVPGADEVTVAFDRLEFPVLAKALQHESLERRRNALRVLEAELGTAASFALAAKAGIGSCLLALLDDADVDVRTRAAAALHAMSQNANGRRHLASMEGGLAGIGAALGKETDGSCRLSLLRAVRALGEEAAALDGLVEHGYVALLAARVAAEEEDEAVAVALDGLGQLFEQTGGRATQEGIDQGIVRVCVDLCGSRAKMVRFRAAASLAALAVPAEGKRAALEAGAVRAAAALLSDASARVLREACGALANVTVLDKAKQEAVGSGALPLLTGLLEHRSSDVRMNASKALANICAHPEGRAFLNASDAPRLLRDIIADSAADDLMKESAQVLLDAILWTP